MYYWHVTLVEINNISNLSPSSLSIKLNSQGIVKVIPPTQPTQEIILFVIPLPHRLILVGEGLEVWPCPCQA